MKSADNKSAQSTQSNPATAARSKTGSQGAAIAAPRYGLSFADHEISAGTLSSEVTQLQIRFEEDLPVQGKFAVPMQRAGEGQGLAVAPRKNNTGLPDALKAGVESLSGMSMDHVRVHRNSLKPAQLQAHAYAQGSEIHLAPGQEQHLPHEAWHVVQQAQGRVRPTMQMKGGVPVNDDVGLEREADVMGGKAVQKKDETLVRHVPGEACMQVIQRMTARINEKYKRTPTAAEIATTTSSSITNSVRLAGHGRARHGKQRETPVAQQEQQVAKDRQVAVDKAIQLKEMTQDPFIRMPQRKGPQITTAEGSRNTGGQAAPIQMMNAAAEAAGHQDHEEEDEGEDQEASQVIKLHSEDYQDALQFGHKVTISIGLMGPSDMEWWEKTNVPYAEKQAADQWVDMFRLIPGSDVFAGWGEADDIYRELEFVDPPSIRIEANRDRLLEFRLFFIGNTGDEIRVFATQRLSTDENGVITRQTFEFGNPVVVHAHPDVE